MPEKRAWCFYGRHSSRPHFFDKLPLLRSHRIGIDGCRRKLRMAQQLLERIERNAGDDGLDAVSMTQSFRGGMRPFDLSCLHNGADVTPGGVSCKRPQVNAAASITALLRRPDVMNHIQRIDQSRGNWHGAVNAASPLFLKSR